MKNVVIAHCDDYVIANDVADVPEGVTLKSGDKVMVKSEGKDYECQCLTDSFTVSEDAYKAITFYFRNPDVREVAVVGKVERKVVPFGSASLPERKRVLRGPNGMSYGEVGKPTCFKDKIGIELKVGDVVHLFDSSGNYANKEFVVCPEDLGRAFVMGIQSCGPTEIDGLLEGGWTIHLHKSFVKVLTGTAYGGVTMENAP